MNGEQVQCHQYAQTGVSTGTCLACVIDGACLTDNRHFDLSRVLQALLDLLRNIASEVNAAQIIDRIWLNHHAHLAPGLDRKGALNPSERCRDGFQSFQPFDIQVERLTPCDRFRTGRRGQVLEPGLLRAE